MNTEDFNDDEYTSSEDINTKKEEYKEETPAEFAMSILKEILINSIYILVVVFATLLLIKYVGQRTIVIGSSMESTLSDGQSLVVDKITYRFNDPKRFDIVVFPYDYEPDTYYIKRVIGLPGETVRIDYDGNIYINEVLLEEHYGREVIQNPGLALEGITLGPDEFFVMGDNRNNSADSRSSSVGPIKKGRIVGRAIFRLSPRNKFGPIPDNGNSSNK